MSDYLLAAPSILAPLTYQMCIYLKDRGWAETGIGVSIEWSCETNAVGSRFEHVFAHETSAGASLTSVISIVFKTGLHSLPDGGVAVIRGLTGSLTPDTDSMDVQGNSVSEEQRTLRCSGQQQCSVRFEDYLENGSMLVSASLSIAIRCTDLDSYGEHVAMLKINGRDVLSKAKATGFWEKCAGNCNSTRNVLVEHDVTAETTPSGVPLHVAMAVSEEVEVYTCDGYMLDALVTLNLVTSRLSTHSMSGTWDQLAGQLNVAHLPYMPGPWIHLSLMLRNPASRSTPRIPTVQLCATTSTSPAVPETRARILGTAGGLLSSSTPVSFAAFHVSQTTDLQRATNRLSILLRSNLPKLMPNVVVITISGLAPTETASTTDFSILAGSGLREESFECVGGLTCNVLLDMSCQSSTCEKSKLHKATLDIDIFCTDFDADDQSKFIQYIRVCRASAGVVSTACAPGTYFEIAPEEYSRGPWQRCGGCSRSTRRVLAAYDMSNFLSAFGYHMIIDIGTSAGVSPLYCYDSYPDVRSVRAVLEVKRIYAVQTAIFTGTQGELIFNPVSAIVNCGEGDTDLANVPCNPELTFDIELTNAIGVQPGSTLTAEAVGAGLSFEPISFGPVLATVDANEMAVVEASLHEVTQTRGDAPGNRGLNRLSLYARFRNLFAGC